MKKTFILALITLTLTAKAQVFKNPKMPYTRGLLNSIPTLSKDPTGKVKRKRLETIPGIVPNLLHLPKGCRFQDRCTYVIDACKTAEPELRSIGPNHKIRCVRDI